MKIFVCEDDKRIAATIDYMLSEIEVDFFIQNEIGGSIDKIFDFQPDLILCDILMHGEYSFKIIRSLKNKEQTKNIPIIAMTALVDKSYKEKAEKAGVNEILEKPFKLNKLNELIKKYSNG